MKKGAWEKIDGFQSSIEFDRFIQWMSEQVTSNAAREVPVAKAYAGATTLAEKWFMHIESGAIWRLVWPDPPFTGVFEAV